jgi:phosphatidylserine/phosphatidylglycerophosphate/cardiolipin synthase-like enzyme
MKRLIFIFLLFTFSLFAKTNELYILPDDSKALEFKIEKLIKKSQDSIHIAMYNFSYKKIAKELKKASKRGVLVLVLLDSSKVKKDDDIYKYLNKNGIKTKLSKKKLHTKLMVFDKKYALLGSINLTKKSFSENYESVLLTDDKKVINKIYKFISKF